MDRKLEAIIFDLDGVIADTVELYYLANKKIADELEISFSKKDNEKFKGINRMSIIEDLVGRSKKKLTSQEKIELGKKKNEIYLELIENLTEKNLLPGIKRFINDLVKNGIRIGLASSSSNAEKVLNKLGIYHYFDTIVDIKTIVKGKPDPEIFLKAADQLMIPYKNCVAVEDGEAGLKGIIATEMFSIGVGTESFLTQADWQIKSTEELNLLELKRRFNLKM